MITTLCAAMLYSKHNEGYNLTNMLGKNTSKNWHYQQMLPELHFKEILVVFV